MAENNLIQAVAKVRAGIAAAAEKIEWLDVARLPKDEAKAHATEWVARVAANGPTALVFAERDDRERGIAVSDFLVGHGTAMPKGNLVDLLPVPTPLAPSLVCLFGADELTKRLHARIDELDYAAGPPALDRARQRADLVKELRELGLQEEALICRAEEASIRIGRRVDADPAVVLSYDPKGTLRDLGRRLFRGMPSPVAASPRPGTGNPAAATPAAAAAPGPATASTPRSSGPGRFASWLK